MKHQTITFEPGLLVQLRHDVRTGVVNKKRKYLKGELFVLGRLVTSQYVECLGSTGFGVWHIDNFSLV